MSFLRVTSWKGVLVHLAIILALSGAIFYSIFYIWLPSYTKYGQEIDVPVLEKMTVSEAEDVLKDRGLRLEIQDTTYNSRYEPGAITRQEPKGNTKVKENRRIYVSINTFEVPLVTINEKYAKGLGYNSYGNVISLINELQLKANKKSKCGKYKDYVECVIYEGDTVKAGSKIRMGGVVDVITWNGNCQ